MNESDSLEQSLLALGAELRTPPSIASAVLKRIALEGADSPLAGAKNALEEGQELVLPSQQEPAQKRRILTADRIPNRRRVLFWSSSTAVAILLVCGILFFFLYSANIVFAQVLKRVGEVQTASFTYKRSIQVRLPDGGSQTKELSRRVLVRGDGRIRTEDSTGMTTILAPDAFIKLELDTARRKVTRHYLYEIEDKQDLLATLRSLHRSAEAVELAPRQIQGIACPGFRIEERLSTLLVWVDPKTKLPMYAERSFSPKLTGNDRDLIGVVDTFSELKFDVPLAEDLFALAPPAGWDLTTVGTPPADRKPLFAEPLVLTPNAGAGPLKFGMARAEIIRLLGAPDKEETQIPHVPVNKDTTEIDGQLRPPGATLVVLTKLHILRYNDLGLWLTVEATEGLRGIQCVSQARVGPEGRTFQGLTDKKIRIGATAQEVIKAYGEPSEKRAGNVWRYAGLHLDFILSEEQKVQEIHLSDAFEHRLQFEWRLPRE